MDKIKKILKNTFFEAVGDIGERGIPFYRGPEKAPAPGPDSIGVVQFKYSGDDIQQKVDQIMPVVMELGAQAPNVDTQFNLLSINIPHKSKDRIINFILDAGFSLDNETWGDEIRGGRRSVGTLSSFGNGSFGSGGFMGGAFPTGYSLTRLIGEADEKGQNKVLFVDFDGTVRDTLDAPAKGKTEKRPPLTPEEVKVFEGVGDRLKKWKELGYVIIGVSNQAGALERRVKGGMTREQAIKAANVVSEKTVKDIESQVGGENLFTAAYFSTNRNEDHKPLPGMAKKAFTDLNIKPDLSNSYMIGDFIPTDGGFAKNVGVKFLKVDEHKLGSDFPLPPK